MRLLLIDSGRVEVGWAAGPTTDLAQALRQAGHDAQILWANAAGEPQPTQPPDLLACTEQEIAGYRQVWRSALDRAVVEFDPQVILVRGAGLLAALALETGVPYLFTATGMGLPDRQRLPRIFQIFEQGVLNASAVIANSAFARQVLQLQFPDLGPMDVIFDPVNATASAPELAPGVGLSKAGRAVALSSLELADCDKLIVAVADPADEAGVELLLNAAALYESCGATTVVLAADRERWQWHGDRLGLTRLVWRDRALDSALRRRLFALADLVIEPARLGLRPRIAQEAMSAGTPVVATNVGALPELIDAEVGALVSPDDHELLAAAILRLLDGNAKSTMSSACRQRIADRCSPPSAAARYAQHSLAALSARHGGIKKP